MAFDSAIDLVNVLRTNPAKGRRELERLCGSCLRRLVAIVKRKYALPDDASHDTDRLVLHITRWLEMYLISQPESVLAAIAPTAEVASTVGAVKTGWEDRFVAFVQSSVFRYYLYGPAVLIREREATWKSLSSESAPLADETHSVTMGAITLDTQWLRLPMDFVSGDISEQLHCNKVLCVLLGDATGHGWLAYPIAQGVSCLWKSLVRSGCPTSPAEVFAQLDSLLSEHLPDGMYIEGVLCRFGENELVSVVAAGACRILTRRAVSGAVSLQTLGDLYLGMGIAQREETQFPLARDDEVALASDGLYEYEYNNGMLVDTFLEQLSHLRASKTLHEALTEVVQKAVRTRPQQDDISVITIRRRSSPDTTP